MAGGLLAGGLHTGKPTDPHRQREIAEAVKERAVLAAAVETGNDAHRIGRQRGEA